MVGLPGAPCPVCRRASGAVRLDIAGEPLHQFCSKECAMAYMTRGAPLARHEEDAIRKGGDAAGAYLDSLGKTDLASMTPEEWRRFCEALFVATCDSLRKYADDGVPF